jgi:hypothetical protein
MIVQYSIVYNLQKLYILDKCFGLGYHRHNVDKNNFI